jgi:hypothetical protein
LELQIFDTRSRTGSNKFVIEGEQHYCVHLAIGRFTAQLIDKQIEEVIE